MASSWEDGKISNGRDYYLWGMLDDSGKENDFREQAHRPVIMGFTKKLSFTFI